MLIDLDFIQNLPVKYQVGSLDQTYPNIHEVIDLVKAIASLDLDPKPNPLLD